MEKTLKEISLGEESIIKKICLSDKRRLLELGFIPNVVVKKEYESIDKKMCGIRVGMNLIGIRASMCEKILVQVKSI